MKKIKFLNTELSVAPLCLGTVNYGSAMPEKEAIHQLSRYVELGGNFIDTAHIYGDCRKPLLENGSRSFRKGTGW